LTEFLKVNFKLEKLVNKELKSEFNLSEVCFGEGSFRSSHASKQELESQVQDFLIMENKAHVGKLGWILQEFLIQQINRTVICDLWIE
jgi:hypothetical protein